MNVVAISAVLFLWHYLRYLSQYLRISMAFAPARHTHLSAMNVFVTSVEIKNELVGKIDKFNSCKKCNSSEKSNSWRLI